MRPLIAITTTIARAEDYPLPQVMVTTPYISAVERCGATAVLVSPAHSPEAREHLLGMAHGLVLSGGDDVSPERYGQEPHPQLQTTNPARDEMEFAVVEQALARAMPVLAICRGLQVLNVALGGTLYQDIPSQVPGDVIHAQTAAINKRWHTARVEAGSRLAEIFGATELFINSFHHQGIERLAGGLRAVAWAEDGLIEGVEGVGYPWVFGVQWHPERGEADMPGDQRNPDARIFWEFVAAARGYGAEGER